MVDIAPSMSDMPALADAALDSSGRPIVVTRLPGNAAFAIDIRNAPPGSPPWWVRRLLGRLEQRRPTISTWDDYYEGNHPLNFFDEAVRTRFGNRFERFASNFTALAIDGLVERLAVNGFRFNNSESDRELWTTWQENDLDGGSQIAHLDALVKGEAYLLVTPDPDGKTPRITVEDAFDTIVELDPTDRRKRRAALKRWVEDDGHLVVYVYLPNAIYRYRSIGQWPTTGNIDGWPWADWTSSSTVPGGGLVPYKLESEDDWPIDNSKLGVVPVVPLPNRPRLGRARDRAWLLAGEGRSEVKPVSSNQDLINYYRAMAVIAARYVAVPQRYAVNLDVAADAKTGQPKPPFRGGLMDLWTVPTMESDDPRAQSEAAQTRFGQFEAADLTPYLRLIALEVRSLASEVGIPSYYLLDDAAAGMTAPSGESIKASEARLTRKIWTIQTFFGEGWEEAERVALKAQNDERASIRTAETRWRRPETLNDAVITDAIVKLYQAGLIDDETSLIDLGKSPLEVERILAALKAGKGSPTSGKAKLPSDAVPSPEAAGAAGADLGTTVNGAGFTQSGGVS